MKIGKCPADEYEFRGVKRAVLKLKGVNYRYEESSEGLQIIIEPLEPVKFKGVFQISFTEECELIGGDHEGN